MADRLNPITKACSSSAGVVVAVAALAIGAVPAMADVKAGVDAWSAGDYSLAVSEWTEPAANGDADALFNLAQAYRLGRGVEPDITRARALYAQAASKGHIKAADNYGLLLFQQGEQSTAMPLIRDAAERGDPRAQYVLGLAHFNADYAPKDWVRAYALLMLANGAGLPQAANALQQMDQYVPLTQRQQAQSIARQLELQATQRRSAALATNDLDSRQQPARQFVAAPPEPVAQSEAAPAPVPVPVQTAARSETRQSPPPATSRPTRVSGNWRIQLGAFGVSGNAERLWERLASNPALAGTQKALVPGGRVTRLQAVGFATRADAQAACNALQRQGQGCIVAGNG
ncbi:MAG: SPOR domain-containing protein [Pseudomonadota bacterium]